MKNRAPLGSSSVIRSRFSAKHIAIPLATLTFLLIAVLSVSAAATFGDVTGPIFLNPGYQFDADVTAMSDPQEHVCIDYSVNGGGNVQYPCTCSLPECDSTTSVGTWECVIPSTYQDATVSWDISAFPGGSCTGTKVLGDEGVFNTDPTALELIGFTVTGWGGFSLAGVVILLGALIAAALILGVLWYSRRNKSPGAKA